MVFGIRFSAGCCVLRLEMALCTSYRPGPAVIPVIIPSDQQVLLIALLLVQIIVTDRTHAALNISDRTQSNVFINQAPFIGHESNKKLTVVISDKIELN